MQFGADRADFVQGDQLEGAHGLDVVVNNAGYANLAPIETSDEADFRTRFETNFWGVYHVSKAVVPQLRAQGGGTVVQFSSVGGRVGGSLGIASYQAAKFAVDGFSGRVFGDAGHGGAVAAAAQVTWPASDAGTASWPTGRTAPRCRRPRRSP